MAWGETTPETKIKWSEEELNRLIGTSLSNALTATSSEIASLKTQIRTLNQENGKLSKALEKQSEYSKTVYQQLVELSKSETETQNAYKKSSQETIRTLANYSEELKKHVETTNSALMVDLKKVLANLVGELNKVLEEHESAISSHSEILRFIKEKLNIAMTESEEKTPEWLKALNTLEIGLERALESLRQEYGEELKALRELLTSQRNAS